MRVPVQGAPVLRSGTAPLGVQGVVPSGTNTQCCGSNCATTYCFFGLSTKCCVNGQPVVCCIAGGSCACP